MLEREGDLEVVGEAQEGRQAVALARKLRPAVVLMDIAMPLLNGLEATRQILKAAPDTKILILSGYNDEAYVTNALESGAAGFVLKQTSVRDMCQAIRKVQKGNTFFAPSVAKRLHGREYKSPTNDRSVRSDDKNLTSREIEVLQLVAEGKANKETAADLGISVKTVEKHRDHLMQKLNIHETAGLTRYAISTGIIESNFQLAMTMV
jgi:DNA-binding NarL/FixJ family response regulator